MVVPFSTRPNRWLAIASRFNWRTPWLLCTTTIREELSCCCKKGRVYPVLGRTARSSLVSCVHHRLAHLGRLPQLEPSSPRRVVSTPESVSGPGVTGGGVGCGLPNLQVQHHTGKVCIHWSVYLALCLSSPETSSSSASKD